MICVEAEKTYIKMTRAFRTFSLMSNKKITALERASRTGDILHDDSVVWLHRCNYKVSEAVTMMQAHDQHLTSDSSFMSAEDVKRFGKGIRTYGKNFNKISKELLPFHQRDQLVSFYYLWKKSREATRPKPLTRQRNAITARRGVRQIVSNGLASNHHHLFGITGGSGNGGAGSATLGPTPMAGRLGPGSASADGGCFEI